MIQRCLFFSLFILAIAWLAYQSTEIHTKSEVSSKINSAEKSADMSHTDAMDNHHKHSKSDSKLSHSARSPSHVQQPKQMHIEVLSHDSADLSRHGTFPRQLQIEPMID